MAGESARRRGESARARAERLIAQAERREKGARGEARTARVLEGLGPGFHALHDLAWPGRDRANIDHVVIGPTGVFVIDTKNWAGRVEVRDDVLRQNGYERELTSGGAAASAIGALVPDHSAAVFPVICLVLDEPMRATTQGVWICSTENVVDLIRSRPTVFDADRVAMLTHRIADATTGHLDRPAVQRSRPATRSRGRALAGVLTAACVFVSVPLVGTAIESLASP